MRSATALTSASKAMRPKHANNSASSENVFKAANSGLEKLSDESEEAHLSTVSEKLALSVHDPVSALAAMFSLFMPCDVESRTRYLSTVAFAYNQNFSDTVDHLNEIISCEIHVERLSVAKHATRQLKTKLTLDGSRRVLLNIERLLKAQGLHNLINYSTVQYLRHELAADFPVLNTTAGENEPDAKMRRLIPSEKMGEEFSRLISLVLDSTDLDRETIDKEYARIMALYPDVDYPLCDKDELAETHETEAAFQLLLMQPQAVRETFIQHCKDIFDLDKEDTESKRSHLIMLCAALGCSSLHVKSGADKRYKKKLVTVAKVA